MAKKLANKFYWPFQITAVIGSVAYQRKLPAEVESTMYLMVSIEAVSSDGPLSLIIYLK